jgi:hypothetical protein
MSAAIWCKDHMPTKTIVHQMHDIVEESGLNALQLYVRSCKEADLALTGTVRKANLITMAAKMSGTPSNPGLRRASTTTLPTNGISGHRHNETNEQSSIVQNCGEKVCITCGVDVSPKWWSIDNAQERELTNGHYGTLGAEAQKFVEQRKFQCHKCKKAKRMPVAHPPKEPTPVPEPIQAAPPAAPPPPSQAQVQAPATATATAPAPPAPPPPPPQTQPQPQPSVLPPQAPPPPLQAQSQPPVLLPQAPPPQPPPPAQHPVMVPSLRSPPPHMPDQHVRPANIAPYAAWSPPMQHPLSSPQVTVPPVLAPTGPPHPPPIPPHSYPPPNAAYGDWHSQPPTQPGTSPHHINGGPPHASATLSNLSALRPPPLAAVPPPPPMPPSLQNGHMVQPILNGMPPSPRRLSGPPPLSTPPTYLHSYHHPPPPSHHPPPPHGVMNGGPPPRGLDPFSQGLLPQRTPFSAPHGSPPVSRDGIRSREQPNPPPGQNPSLPRPNESRPASGASASPSLRNLLS